jgi:hypothetical protein
VLVLDGPTQSKNEGHLNNDEAKQFEESVRDIVADALSLTSRQTDRVTATPIPFCQSNPVKLEPSDR